MIPQFAPIPILRRKSGCMISSGWLARGGQATFGFVDGRLWAVAGEIAAPVDAQVGGPRNPHVAQRLRNIENVVAAIERTCQRVKTTETDTYGNDRVWEGDRGGGKIHVRYGPTRDTGGEIRVAAR
jgi:hypothetical protein